jgi:anti-anti-sigma factor
MKLVYNFHKTDGPEPCVVLALNGCVDSETAPKFGNVMDIVFERHDCPLIVDMSAVMYISSAGWREFVRKAQGVIDRRIHIRIVGMQPTVRDVFELIGLHNVFESYDSVQDAIEAPISSNET